MNKTLPLLLALVLASNAFSAEIAAPVTKETRASLTDKEREILDNGPMADGSYIAGGVLGTVLGLGIGHAVQGRYGSLGWVFTLTEVVGAAAYIGGATCSVSGLGFGTTSCTFNTTASIGLAVLLGFHIWEIVDVWAAPPAHNKAYRRLKKRLGEKIEDDEAMNFFITPVANNQSLGAAAGFTYRF